MAWNPNIPTVTNRVQDDLNAIRENFQHLDPLAPYIQALLSSRIVGHNLDVPNPPNGWYVRWENGLQVVFGEVALGSVSLSASGSVYASPNLTITFPAAFSTGMYAWCVNSDAGLGLTWAGLGSEAQGMTGSITFRLYGGSALSNSNVRVAFFAIGRWK